MTVRVHPVVLRLRDDYGEWVTAGDTVYFYYGIPPVAVDAAIIERNGKLIGLCPGVQLAFAPAIRGELVQAQRQN